MSESNSFNEFFTGWFGTLEKGLEKLNEQECACLFSECGKTCAWYVVNYIYKKLFDECEGDDFYSGTCSFYHHYEHNDRKCFGTHQ